MFSLIVFLPLLNSCLVGIWGYRIGTKGTAAVTLLSLYCSVILAFFCLFKFTLNLVPFYIDLFSWILLSGFSANWAISIDSLTVLMFLLITAVSSLVYTYVRFLDLSTLWKKKF